MAYYKSEEQEGVMDIVGALCIGLLKEYLNSVKFIEIGKEINSIHYLPKPLLKFVLNLSDP